MGVVAHVFGVVTTGIYCCPSGCSGRPKRENRRRYPSAAAAEAAGFRACHVCRPYRQQPGLWVDAPELVCRALQLVLDGALDDGGTEGTLARRVGASPRHLRRLFLAHVGVTPTQLARSARAHFARRLIDDTDLPFGDIATAACFGSIRQFNKVMRDTFKASPSELRTRRRRSDRLVADGGLPVRLPFGPPLAHADMLALLEAAAVPGVESVHDGWYRRTIAVAGDAGVVEIGPGGPAHLVGRFHLPHWEPLLHLVQRARRVFALDVDVGAAERDLEGDTRTRPWLRRRPGLRAPGTWDAFEVGVAALVRLDRPDRHRQVLAALVEAHGTPVAGLTRWGLTHRFPCVETLASGSLAGLGMSAAGQRRLGRFASGVAEGGVVLDRSVGQGELAAQLAPLGPCAGALAAELSFRLGAPLVSPPGATNGDRESAIAVAHRQVDGRPLTPAHRGQGWVPPPAPLASATG
jgi:AraC family transcriptional regulator of adaptative response / DNA-3-methyladenine glycosylase II